MDIFVEGIWAGITLFGIAIAVSIFIALSVKGLIDG